MIGDWLASLHTRRAAYRGISLALLGLAIFFAVRIGEMYTALLARFGAGHALWQVPLINITLPAGQIGLFLVQAIITIAFAYLGFYLSTHQAYVLEALQERTRRHAAANGLDPQAAARKVAGQFGWAIWLVIANDIASSVYVVVSGVQNLSLHLLQTDLSLDIEMLASIVAWTVIVVLEFKLGPFLLALAESLPTERKQQLALEGIEQVQALKQQALGIVAKEGRRKMDIVQAQQIIQRTAQRRVEEEHDPLMQDFLRELQDIALAAGPLFPALPEGREEPPNTITDELPAVSVETAAPQAQTPDKLAATIEVLTAQPDISDDALAEALGLKKEISAHYWRIKALEALASMAGMAEPVVTAKSNGHAGKGGQAGSSRSFRFPGFGRRNGSDEEEEDEDDLSLWE